MYVVVPVTVKLPDIVVLPKLAVGDEMLVADITVFTAPLPILKSTSVRIVVDVELVTLIPLFVREVEIVALPTLTLVVDRLTFAPTLADTVATNEPVILTLLVVFALPFTVRPALAVNKPCIKTVFENDELVFA